MGEFGDHWGDDFEQFEMATKMKAKPTFNTSVKTTLELRNADRAKIIIPKPEGAELYFEDLELIPEYDKMEEYERNYWMIRTRTNIPREFGNMARVNVCMIIF